MRNYICQTVATSISSISHNAGESFGINSKLRREKFVQPDGNCEEVPVISGNAIRGILRDAGMAHMCRAMGVPLTLPAFHFLFSGGSLTSDPAKALGMKDALRVRQLIPLASVFGGAIGNVILPGKLDMGKLIPICEETRHLLPARFAEMKCASVSVHEFLQDEMYTRRDDSSDQRKAAWRLDEARSDDTAQMLYYIETFAAGTAFYWQIILRDVSDLEFDAFATALRQWLDRPVIGGKGNIGMGQMRVDLRQWICIDSASQDAVQVELPDGNLYRMHLANHAEEIRSVLARL